MYRIVTLFIASSPGPGAMAGWVDGTKVDKYDPSSSIWSDPIMAFPAGSTPITVAAACASIGANAIVLCHTILTTVL